MKKERPPERLSEPRMARVLAAETKLAAVRDAEEGELRRASEEASAATLPTLTERNRNDERVEEMQERVEGLDARHARLVEVLVARGLREDCWTEVGGEAVYPRKADRMGRAGAYERWEVLRASPAAARRWARLEPGEVVRLSGRMRAAAGTSVFGDFVVPLCCVATGLICGALLVLVMGLPVGDWWMAASDEGSFFLRFFGSIGLMGGLLIAAVVLLLSGAVGAVEAAEVRHALRTRNRASVARDVAAREIGGER